MAETAKGMLPFTTYLPGFSSIHDPPAFWQQKRTRSMSPLSVLFLKDARVLTRAGAATSGSEMKPARPRWPWTVIFHRNHLMSYLSQ